MIKLIGEAYLGTCDILTSIVDCMYLKHKRELILRKSGSACFLENYALKDVRVRLFPFLLIITYYNSLT